MAQSGSAPGLGPGGRRFESCLLDILKGRAHLDMRPGCLPGEEGSIPFVPVPLFLTWGLSQARVEEKVGDGGNGSLHRGFESLLLRRARNGVQRTSIVQLVERRN